MKKNDRFILLLLTLCIWGCSKDADGISEPGLMYGSWKTNYGDTVIFSQKNGANIATFTAKLNPQQSLTTRSDHAFDYRNGQLTIAGTSGSATVYSFHATWTDPGRSFQVPAGDWFDLYSTGLGVIIFTKTPR